MRIGIVGAGKIGGNCAVEFAKGGHEVMLSSRNADAVQAGERIPPTPTY